VWPALVTRLVVPQAVRPLSPEDDRVAVDGLFDLLDEFLAETTAMGSGSIDREYFLWLQQQSWYNLDLERFHSSPPPQMVGSDEAAERLGVQRSALFDLVASGRLRSCRVGAEVLFTEHDISELESQVNSTPTARRGADG
jgi:excisionase family DNA binding protein